ncbi:GNAT family N-acetyltransferase [Kitasatospora aureofaciens]|uniref:GCN5 family N-acetyltransferase n=1 Tax=Kitasatospora aureofaciens TaxID=1894 RepID=A0A8H9LT88_KITAU|nr:GNAT family N-acetyltransferase [Kitasatospora aureofaciens]UKZ06516.1 GNAT family N-acetyltransferase [Streptomyces viridifaciens]GGU82757.1 GCN5 family N-acetyltransferase [Kitasatospora aureofaciens]
MKIRTGGLADIPDILSMLDGAIAWLAAQGRTGQWGDQPFSTNPARVEHIEQYAAEPFLIRLAVDDEGRTVGCCVLAEEPGKYIPLVDERELYVRHLVTDRSRKGSGIGAALIADAVEEARRRGIGLLRVDCYAGADRKLVGQYRALGFTETVGFEVEQPTGTWPGQVLEIRL